MNNSDMAMFFLKQALLKSLQSGGVTMIEELAEALPQEQLSKFIVILKKVHDRRQKVVNAT